jgi:DNA invertase Pin-like site-specific DNA recombinase/DNA-binding transcriptional regulator YiaG
MLTEALNKVTAAHLQREAFLYIRQSSLRQVLENTESTQRQYALRERAVALGWPIERIHVIDTDLGQSGAESGGREGFQYLVSELALGHAGLVMGLEVSRLARNNADWHRLLELSALTGTLILDEDGLYDPVQFNDRLLLGLKGTLSEAELHVLKARLQGGIRNKARRGELELRPPIGFIRAELGKLALDPDRQVQATLRMLFDLFRQLGSAMAVTKRFRKEGWLFPRRPNSGLHRGDLLWGPVVHSRVLQILHNPRYAGAFVYGRTRTRPTPEWPSRTRRVPREDWAIVIPDWHVGYLTWEEFERNQATLRANALSFSPDGRGARPREGPALLQGRVLCGRCGQAMRVRYQEVGGRLEPYYLCTESAVRRGERPCQSMRGSAVDAALGELLVNSVTPEAVEQCLANHENLARHLQEAEALRQAQLERARYEAELARRRYCQVDPAHRLVADTLEAEWEARLRTLQDLQAAHDRQRQADQASRVPDARDRVRDVVADFRALWQDAGTPALERKRIIALLIEDVTLLREGETIALHVRFRGGRLATREVPAPKPMSRVRKTLPEVVARLDQLLDGHSDREVAEHLNAEGYGNWKHEPFTAKRVSLVRRTYGLKSRFERLRERGFLTGGELGQRLGVSTTTVHQWGRDGILEKETYGNSKRCLYAPLPAGETIVKGQGCKHPRPPRPMAAPSTEQETV